jgi:hypothetical protein
VIAAAPADAALLLLMSHGMGPHYDGTHLLEEVLTRLDRDYRGKAGGASASALAKAAVRPLVPMLHGIGHSLPLPAAWRRAVGDAVVIRDYAQPGARARQSFFLEPNNYVFGGIRLNLEGREPRGCVAPHEADALCERLEADLKELVNVATGGPVVRGVERCELRHGRTPDDTMPDLFIDWERSAPIETVRSPKIGTIHSPYRGWRSGDHRPDGLLVAIGPQFPAGVSFPRIIVEDLAPTIASRLGVALADVDGRIISWLAE